MTKSNRQSNGERWTKKSNFMSIKKSRETVVSYQDISEEDSVTVKTTKTRIIVAMISIPNP